MFLCFRKNVFKKKKLNIDTAIHTYVPFESVKDIYKPSIHILHHKTNLQMEFLR